MRPWGSICWEKREPGETTSVPALSQKENLDHNSRASWTQFLSLLSLSLAVWPQLLCLTSLGLSYLTPTDGHDNRVLWERRQKQKGRPCRQLCFFVIFRNLPMVVISFVFRFRKLIRAIIRTHAKSPPHDAVRAQWLLGNPPVRRRDILL